MLRDARIGVFARALYSYYPELEQLSERFCEHLQDVPVPDPLPAARNTHLTMLMMCVMDALSRAGAVIDSYHDVSDKSGMGREVRTAYVAGLARPIWELVMFKVYAPNGDLWDPMSTPFRAFHRQHKHLASKVITDAEGDGPAKEEFGVAYEMHLNDPWPQVEQPPKRLRVAFLRAILPDEDYMRVTQMCDTPRVFDPE